MSGQPFYKLCGSGNDFVFLDSRTADPAAWTTDRIARVCARATGVGADGLIIIGPGSRPGAVQFRYFNSDGSSGAMCGNGALCATRLSVLLELAPPDAVVLETEAGIVRGRLDPASGARAELSLPDVQRVEFPAIEPDVGEDRAGFAIVGVPHVVVPVRDLEAVPLMGRGRELRHHAAIGPGGANVNFVASGAAGWAMRTYERGVEAETLACGTGAVACAIILASAGRVSLPWSVRSRAGGTITVTGELEPGRGLRNPRLSGEARLVFRGTLAEDL
jgi:diaminopimelate epimerase